MISKEYATVAEAGAECYIKYWKRFVKLRPDYASRENLELMGVIFFSGFSDGYDYCKKLMTETEETEETNG